MIILGRKRFPCCMKKGSFHWGVFACKNLYSSLTFKKLEVGIARKCVIITKIVFLLLLFLTRSFSPFDKDLRITHQMAWKSQYSVWRQEGNLYTQGSSSFFCDIGAHFRPFYCLIRALFRLPFPQSFWRMKPSSICIWVLPKLPHLAGNKSESKTHFL